MNGDATTTSPEAPSTRQRILIAAATMLGENPTARLSVRLLGDRARVSVNGARAIVLPVMGSDGTTFSNGRQTLTIRQGQLSWGLGRAMPVPCRGG